ncbi:MAG: HEAT repeat domain-containing protein [Planctomycetota bacterium]|jgi:hypothetical protein
MIYRRTVIAILTLLFVVVSPSWAQQLEENWNDFLHYTKIGLFDLAKGHGQALLQSDPDPLALLELIEENQADYAILLRVKETAPDAELAELSSKILDLIEQAKFIRRTDPKVIAQEIRRLSGTMRGRLAAVKRLQNAGEYAIVYMLDAMEDDSRRDELPNIIWALPQIGRDSIRPLVTALQNDDVLIKTEIIKALGKVGYRQPLAYLKYIAEKSQSGEVSYLAKESIKQIDPAALKIPAAELFFQLAEDYYYHSQSLEPAEDADFANIWFWDSQERRLVLEKVDKKYFNELMTMRSCEWALKTDDSFGKAIGLWLAAFFKAEATGLNMPDYFGPGHANAMVYAKTAGAEYLHLALARAIKDKNADIARGAVEALSFTAGEKSLFYRFGTSQPLVDALSFDDKPVRYSAAIAIALAGPTQMFPERAFVIKNLAEALNGSANNNQADQQPAMSNELADRYAIRAIRVMLKLAETKNPVIDLNQAKDALIKVVKWDNRKRIKLGAAKILAYLRSPDAQRAIAGMALAEDNDMKMRIAAFRSLAVSAKINASQLDDETIDAIYSLAASQQIDPKLRTAAASAFGALNLPSRKVKELILDQAKS